MGNTIPPTTAISYNTFKKIAEGNGITGNSDVLSLKGDDLCTPEGATCEEVEAFQEWLGYFSENMGIQGQFPISDDNRLELWEVSKFGSLHGDFQPNGMVISTEDADKQTQLNQGNYSNNLHPNLLMQAERLSLPVTDPNTFFSQYGNNSFLSGFGDDLPGASNPYSTQH